MDCCNRLYEVVSLDFGLLIGERHNALVRLVERFLKLLAFLAFLRAALCFLRHRCHRRRDRRLQGTFELVLFY